MTYAGKTVDEVRALMNARYAQGDAYAAHMPWDLDRHHLEIEAVVKYATETGCGDVLDVGCAGGGMIDELRLTPGFTSYTGLDLSDEVVKRAQAAHPEGLYVSGAIESATWSEAFDTVVSVESIEHWADVHAGLDRVRRALRWTGRLIVSTPNRDSLHVRIGQKLGRAVPYCAFDHVKEYGFEELIDLVCSHGFRHLDAAGVGLMPYWALEGEFGTRIRNLTDNDPDVFHLLNRLGTNTPEVAFVQVHCFAPRGYP